MADVEKVNARLEEAALTTARALAEIAGHWDAVYEAMRRKNSSEEPAACSTASRRRTAAVAKSTKWEQLPHEKKLRVLEGLDHVVDDLKKIRKDIGADKRGKGKAA